MYTHNLFFFQHVRLPQYLHGVDVASVQLLHQSHLPEGPPADDLEALEVLLAQPRAAEAEELRLLLRMLVAMILTLAGREREGEKVGEGGREGGKGRERG